MAVDVIRKLEKKVRGKLLFIILVTYLNIIDCIFIINHIIDAF